MRSSTSGTTCPTCSATWPHANTAQALATNTAFTAPHVPCAGARAAGGVLVVSARSELPLTAGGCAPNLSAYVDADDFVTIRASNNNANSLVDTTKDITLDVLQLPLVP